MRGHAEAVTGPDDVKMLGNESRGQKNKIETVEPKKLPAKALRCQVFFIVRRENF